MNIYIVAVIDRRDFYQECIEVHYCTSYEKAIDFLRKAVEDSNSGIKENTIIDISTDIIDEYFSTEAKSVDRKRVKEFLST